ncbi:hypothetical protein VTN77DRAFT_1110 [Rasamsonia byssochlamydoides]|uniref:uncharacterized protein n=1 Tax=Rasamsonia byssochlamydoides TaxID=89139 RepID=UPI003744AAA0
MISPQHYRVILLNVALHCDISTLLNLRLVDHTTKSLLESDEASICTAAIQRSSFNHLLFLRDPQRVYQTSLEGIAKFYHRQQVVQKVTELRFGLDWTPLMNYPMLVDDPGSAPFRKRIEDGWCLLYHFADIAAEIEEAAPRDETDRPSKSWRSRTSWGRKRRQVAATKKRERKVLLARVEFLKSFSDYELRSFVLLWYAITTSPHFRIREQLPWCDTHWSENVVTRGESWLSWYILRHGPDWFCRLWERRPGDDDDSYFEYHCVKSENETQRVQRGWEARPQKISRVEQEGAFKIWGEISNVYYATCRATGSISKDVHQYERYWLDNHTKA